MTSHSTTFTIENKYSITHYLTGAIINYYPKTIYVVLVYQLIQLFLNKRFFLLDNDKLRNGNSLFHTINKMFQYLIGYIITGILRSSF